MKNEILEEVWRVKDALAAKNNYDIDAMFRDLRVIEKTSGRRYVDLSKSPRRTKKPKVKAKDP